MSTTVRRGFRMEKATEAESGEKPEGDEVPDLEGLQARRVSPMGTPRGPAESRLSRLLKAAWSG